MTSKILDAEQAVQLAAQAGGRIEELLIFSIVLTVGIAVDSNVLIYERIREELRGGRNAISAIDAGFKRVLELNPRHPLVVGLAKRVSESGSVDEVAEAACRAAETHRAVALPL